MTTFREAIAQMGLSPDDAEGVRALVSIDGKEVKHRTLADIGNRMVTDFNDRNLYTTLAKYTPGEGRKAEHATSVDMFMFDADLKDYLGYSHEQLQALPHDVLDMYVQALMKEVIDVFERAGIPIHRIDCTGYGVAVYSRIHPGDQGRVADIDAMAKRLIERVNDEHAGRLVDPAVSDPLSRIMRIVGSLNHKGPVPRKVYTLWEREGSCHLAAFPVEAKPRQRSLGTRRVEEKRLEETVLDDIVLALSGEYAEGSRNAIAFGLPAMLYKSGVPRDQALTIVERGADSDEELENRIDACVRTYDRAEAGQSVIGFHWLNNWLTPQTRDHVSRLLNRFKQSVIISGISEEAPLQGDVHSYGNIYDPPPASCFYGLAGEYRNLVAPTTTGPDAYHLASFLGFASATIGRRASIYQAREHIPALYFVLVGDSGKAKKDTCVERAKEFFDLQVKTVGEVIEPLPYRILKALSTWEGMLADMQTHQTSQLMLNISEFDTLLNKAEREVGRGIIPNLTALWDGLPHVDLPTRKDPIRISEPYVTLLATTTPYKLSRELDPGTIHSGFANRVLWIFGSGKGRIARPPKVDMAEAQRLMAEFLRNVNHACAGGREFVLDPRAEQMFDDWDAELYDRDFLNEDERSLSERLEPQALRIALVFAASDGTATITDEHLEPAIKLVEWQFEIVRKEARMWGSNDDAKLGQAILQLLRIRPCTRLEIFDSLERWGSSALKRSIDNMIDMDKIKQDLKTGIIQINTNASVREETVA